VPVVSIVCGALLIALGVTGYIATEAKTALIPAVVGGLIAVCGVVGLKESLLKHAMHAAAAIGLLGFLAAMSRFVPKLLGDFDWSDPATAMTGKMALVCGVFVALCVNSFIQARRRRAASAAAPGA
jgi:hypothetical protein